MTRAAIYCRISLDRTDDTTGEKLGLGVKRQEKDCRALCKAKGWEVADVLVDNDVSAFSGKRRPEYVKLCQGIDVGLYDVLVIWHPDRLHRSPKELESFIDLVERTGVKVATCTAGDYDLSTPDGRLTARIVGSVARKESEDKSRRLKRKHDEKAEKGLPHGSRAFGYEKDGVTVNEREAELLRQAAADVLAGEALRAIAVRWNDLGVLTPQRGVLWSGTVVRSVLSNPRHAGLRVHRGEVVGQGVWPAIIDEVTHRRLVRMFNDPARKRVPPRRQAYTGVLKCWNCHGPLARRVSHGRVVYACTVHTGPRQGCGRVTVSASAELVVLDALVALVESADFAEALRKREQAEGDTSPEDAAELERIAGQLVELAEVYAAGDLPMAEWLVARKGLEARQEELTARVTVAHTTSVLAPYVGAVGVLRDAWESDTLSTDRKRAILAAVFAEVTVGPAVKLGNKLDLGRFTFVPAFDYDVEPVANAS